MGHSHITRLVLQYNCKLRAIKVFHCVKEREKVEVMIGKEQEKEEGKSNSRQGGNAGSIAAGVLVPLILVAVVATLVVVTLIWLKR